MTTIAHRDPLAEHVTHLSHRAESVFDRAVIRWTVRDAFAVKQLIARVRELEAEREKEWTRGLELLS